MFDTSNARIVLIGGRGGSDRYIGLQQRVLQAREVLGCHGIIDHTTARFDVHHILQ